MGAPSQEDVDQLRELLDLMESFASNDQRARYLLTSNWLRDRGAAAAAHLTGEVECVCPGSEQPFKGRHVPRDRRAACPACRVVVEISAALDGGPGGVYEPHRVGGLVL